MQRASFVTRITPEWPPGTYFGSKNAPEFTSEMPKIGKLVEKSRFLTQPFFNRFFLTKKRDCVLES